jgi:hypothetical protein
LRVACCCCHRSSSPRVDHHQDGRPKHVLHHLKGRSVHAKKPCITQVVSSSPVHFCLKDVQAGTTLSTSTPNTPMRPDVTSIKGSAVVY